MRNKLVYALALAGVLSPLLAQAGPQQMLLLIDMLKENGTLTEIQHQQLKAAMMAEDPTPSSKQPPAQQTLPLPASEPVDVMVSTQGGSVKVESYDGRSSFQLTAQIAADAAWYDSDITDMGNAAEIRYARIGAEGTLFGPWEYELEIDF
ncbi:MAG: porin, partial [endosymbiont of Lamellibrachia luymesi]